MASFLTLFINFNVSASSPSYTCLNGSGLIKFYVPYYLTFHFYKAKDQTSTDVVQYKNEFQYVVIQNFSQSNKMNTFTDLYYLDNWFGWMPFYTKGKLARAKNTDISFWAQYEDGAAVVKAYGPGNFSINMLTSNIRGFSWDEEFTFPQYDPNWKLTRLSTGIIIQNDSSRTIDVYATLWEVNKWRLARDGAFYIIGIVIYFVILILMLSAGVNNWKAIVGYTIGFVVLLKSLGWVWL